MPIGAPGCPELACCTASIESARIAFDICRGLGAVSEFPAVMEDKTISSSNKDIFYNIKYSGLDLSGNRYILTSKEAMVDKNVQEIVNMKFVNAVFYFKDNTVLLIFSELGKYNNKTLDMEFDKAVRANYENNELLAEKAEYSNSQGYLSITKNVKVNSNQGNLVADKLLFDIKKQTLDIYSFNDNKINAKLKLDEKRF